MRLEDKGLHKFHHGCRTSRFVTSTHLIYPMTVRVVGAQQMILQPVSSIFPVLHCRLVLGELQACPLPDVVFPPLPLSALSSYPFHCALQYGWLEQPKVTRCIYAQHGIRRHKGLRKFHHGCRASSMVTLSNQKSSCVIYLQYCFQLSDPSPTP